MEDIETTAANVDEIPTADGTTQPDSPTEKPVDQTKAFAKRLKEEVEKARTSERESIAKSYGYESWEEFNKAQTDSKLLDSGLDPETVRPVLKDLIQSDPDYIEGIRYKQEKQKLEADIWAEQELQRMNSKLGTSVKNINDLDEKTVELWNKGMSLEQAYVSQHFNELQEKAIADTKSAIGSGKEHLSNPGTSSGQGVTRELSAEELRIFKRINPDMSDEAIKNYINKRS